ncbi:barley mlo defense gene homolog2 [Zea mays]|uniref:MLO-like protein n=1 Tax=Zea mays TaxID=4577 RepID=A0A1D6K7P7_MAIZE|nr:barley mlo defense gene homolog2 [Zea mays]
MGGDGTRALDQTPTWAVAAVCAVIVAASILLEGFLHHLGQLLNKKRKKALFDALEKVKSELMTLGFISLLLTVTGRYIARICIPEGAANTMLPCRLSGHSVAEEPKGHGRRHLSEDPTNLFSCRKGMVSLVSADGMHQLHIFVFFLAVFHVTFSFFTMSLGRAKTRIWKVWEKETCSPQYNYLNDPSKFRLTHQTSFVRQHASCWSKSTITLYFVSFFRQFFRSVRKTDYFTLRHGFISAHLSPGTRFNFRKYIKRSLEDDFKTVVGISPPLWASALAVMLFNVHGWHNLFWFSAIPLVVILAVGTKLQAIIAMMAIEIAERHTVIQGMPVVKLSDDHFWFGKPRLVLHLIHFASFQNAFEITYFFWIWVRWLSRFGNIFCGTVVVCVKFLLTTNICAVRIWPEGYRPVYVQLHHPSTLCPCFSDGFRNEANNFRRADSEGPEEMAQGRGEEETPQGFLTQFFRDS